MDEGEAAYWSGDEMSSRFLLRNPEDRARGLAEAKTTLPHLLRAFPIRSQSRPAKGDYALYLPVPYRAGLHARHECGVQGASQR